MSGIGNFFKAAVFIFSILTLQLNVFPVLDYIPVKPDLFLVLAVACGIRNSPLFKAVSWGIFLGLLKDIFSIRFFGFNSFAFAADVFIISLLCRRFYKESLWFNLILIFCAGMLNCLLFSLVAGRLYFVIGMAEAALNCLFFPLVKRIYDLTIDQRP